jgi:hypothetical protein
MTLEKVDMKNPLADYFVLYTKDRKPMLDPCFYEYIMKFICGHEKSFFQDKYTMADQYCDECNAMREVREFAFVGVPLEQIDIDKPYETQIHLSEWDVEAKAGMYFLCRPWKMPNGKYIARTDFMAAGNFGIPPKESDKYAELARARISDQTSITVFEIPDYVFNVPIVMETAKRYLEAKDVYVLKMIQGARHSDGTIEFTPDTWIKDPKDIQIPTPKTIT